MKKNSEPQRIIYNIMIRVLITFFAFLGLLFSTHSVCLALSRPSPINAIIIIFTLLSCITLIILYFKEPGFATQELCSSLSQKSKIPLQSPKLNGSQRQVSFGGIPASRKQLQSSLIIYKQRIQSLHEKRATYPDHQSNEAAINDARIPDEKIQMDAIEERTVVMPHQVAVYMEQPICQSCNILQPLRVKHCRRCNKCILTYDHHSPFTNRCVGEKNKYLFIFQILFSVIWLANLLGNTFPFMLFPQTTMEVLLTGTQLILASAAIFYSALLLFQGYLTTTNQTTYENQHRSTVAYLKLIPEETSYPFGQGWRINLSSFFQYSFTDTPFQWNLD